VKKKLQHPVQSPRWYGSKEVAAILDTEEWRIRNFGSKLYGLEAQIKSPGSGNRKRYFFDVVLKLAVANELYSAHVSPIGIKAALKLIKDQKLIEKWIASFGGDGHVPEMVLSLDVRIITSEQDGQEVKRLERIWNVFDAAQSAKLTQDFSECGAVAISLPLIPLWDSVVRRMTDLEAKGKI